MHSAPSVIYPVGRSFWQGRIVAMLWLAGLAAALGFAVATEAGWPSVAIGLAVALAGAAGWYGTRTALQGRLQFDGRQWLWWPQALAGAAPAEPQTLAALVVQVDCSRCCCCGEAVLARRRCGCGSNAAPRRRCGTMCAVRYIRRPAFAAPSP